jgi:hypothetical protein
MTIKIPCHCQDPSEPGVLHRVDGPCQTIEQRSTSSPLTSIEVIAKALGGGYVSRGDAAAIVEELKAAGYVITRFRA